jgi:hypothetical protein
MWLSSYGEMIHMYAYIPRRSGGNIIYKRERKLYRCPIVFRDDTPGCTAEACSFRDADHEQQEERTLGKPLHI